MVAFYHEFIRNVNDDFKWGKGAWVNVEDEEWMGFGASSESLFGD